MRRWDYKINIKQHLSEGVDKASMEKSMNGIRAELSGLPYGLTAHPSVKRFFHYAKLAIDQEDVNIFNLGMDSLYDWADEYRIWLGIK